jgi:tRNA A37 threonylcarbamoyladenosine modification protein TsaB
MVRAVGKGPELRRPLLVAGRGKVYTGLFQFKARKLTQLETDIIVAPESIDFESRDEPVLIFGNGSKRYREVLSDRSPASTVIRDYHPTLSSTLIELAVAQLEGAGEILDKPIEIRYLRRPTNS